MSKIIQLNIISSNSHHC